jgi:hypothetical protein
MGDSSSNSSSCVGKLPAVGRWWALFPTAGRRKGEEERPAVSPNHGDGGLL